MSAEGRKAKASRRREEPPAAEKEGLIGFLKALSVLDEVTAASAAAMGYRGGGAARQFVLTSCRGQPVLRRYVVPRNPNTARQREHRARFADAVAAWRDLSPEEKASYNRRARGVTGYNLFVSEYMRERSPDRRDEAPL